VSITRQSFEGKPWRVACRFSAPPPDPCLPRGARTLGGDFRATTHVCYSFANIQRYQETFAPSGCLKLGSDSKFWGDQ